MSTGTAAAGVLADGTERPAWPVRLVAAPVRRWLDHVRDDPFYQLAAADDTGKGIRRWTALVVVAVAAFAAVVSYSHIYDLAHAHGQDGVSARLTPLSVDGLILSASLVLLHEARAGRRAPLLARLALWLGVAATVAANVGYGLPFGAIGAMISAWPALAFVLSVEMLMGLVRRARTADVPGDGDRTALYRLFDAADELLYVGIALSPDIRWKEHARTKGWWPEVARKEVTWHESWDAAARAELTAIEAEEPKYNIARHLDPGRRLDVPKTVMDAACAAYRESVQGGNPLSGRQLEARFGISRRRAEQVRAKVAQELPDVMPPRGSAGNGTPAKSAQVPAEVDGSTA